MKRLLGIAILVLLLPACYDREARMEEVQALMDSTLQEKIEGYRQRLAEDCRERMLSQAALKADSIILARARLYRDTSHRPARPEKPGKPEPIPLDDTTPVRPLLSKKDSLLQPTIDTMKR